MKGNTFFSIALMCTLGITATVVAFLAQRSLIIALLFVWMSVLICSAYSVGKRVGRSERGCRRKNSLY